MTTTEMSSGQLVELTDVLKGSDTVELKLTVDDSTIRSAGQSLGFDALEAQIRQLVFFNAPDLAIDANGLVVRARRIQGGGDTTKAALQYFSSLL